MKKLILFSILSVLFYSAPGYAGKPGQADMSEEEAGAGAGVASLAYFAAQYQQYPAADAEWQKAHTDKVMEAAEVEEILEQLNTQMEKAKKNAGAHQRRAKKRQQAAKAREKAKLDAQGEAVQEAPGYTMHRIGAAAPPPATKPAAELTAAAREVNAAAEAKVSDEKIAKAERGEATLKIAAEVKAAARRHEARKAEEEAWELVGMAERAPAPQEEDAPTSSRAHGTGTKEPEPEGSTD